MKIKYLRVSSDLHLEQYYQQSIEKIVDKFIPNDDRDAESVLILAGDISSKPDQLVEFLKFIEQRFLKVIFVPGNHEYYHHNMIQWELDLDASLKQNTVNTLYALGKVESILYENVFFIFGTLWADGGFTLTEKGRVGNALWDFKIIEYKGGAFKVSDMFAIHTGMKKQISDLLKTNLDVKRVVVSHHLPSYQLCHPRFGTEINGGFAGNCDDIIKEDKPDFWIFGHTHDTYDIMLHESRMISNPSGYHGEFRNQPEFNNYSAKFIEVE